MFHHLPSRHIAGSYHSRSKKKERGRYTYRKPHTVVRYGVLLTTIVVFVAGSNLLVNLLDPFSVFGRIITNLFRPVAILINNSLAIILEQFGNYWVPREHLAAMALPALFFAAVMLLVVFWMAIFHGRLYCNSLCPVGSLLGIVSKFSLLKLQIDESSCSRCGRCVQVCKASCIDITDRTVDMSRCVSCYNCLTACKNSSIGFGRRYGKSAVGNKGGAADQERRNFIVSSGVSLISLMGFPEVVHAAQTGSFSLQAKPTIIPVVRTSPVSPPGSISIAHFNKTCTACHLCISACPSQVMVPSALEYGLDGFLQPRLRFDGAHCDFECTICGAVCPAGAILPLSVEEKKLTQTGTARFIKENCVVYTDNTACGACSEHCPTKAVNMVPYDNPSSKELGIPEIRPELCVGCGGCEHACPTRPHKAIFVDGNGVHKLAQKPVVQEVEHQIDMEEEFPF